MVVCCCATLQPNSKQKEHRKSANNEGLRRGMKEAKEWMRKKTAKGWMRSGLIITLFDQRNVIYNMRLTPPFLPLGLFFQRHQRTRCFFQFFFTFHFPLKCLSFWVLVAFWEWRLTYSNQKHKAEFGYLLPVKKKKSEEMKTLYYISRGKRLC